MEEHGCSMLKNNSIAFFNNYPVAKKICKDIKSYYHNKIQHIPIKPQNIQEQQIKS